MSGLPRRFFSGTTLQQALLRAAQHHGCEPERLAWREVDRSGGSLKGRQAVVIEVDPDAPLRQAAGAAAPPPPLAAPAPSESEAAVEAPCASSSGKPAPEERAEPAAPSAEHVLAVRQAAEMLFAFARLRLESSVALEGDGVRVELTGPDRERATAEHGRALYAIQHLLPRLLWGLTGQALPVRVDCGNFHASQEEELRELALAAAAKVRERGRPWHLEPMAPHERRIVHLALADDPEVTTESVGEGYLKRVRIKPAQGEPAASP
jgi:spoIIIJ-associated protein